jgi:hypothetical protein
LLLIPTPKLSQQAANDVVLSLELSKLSEDYSRWLIPRRSSLVNRRGEVPSSSVLHTLAIAAIYRLSMSLDLN